MSDLEPLRFQVSNSQLELLNQLVAQVYILFKTFCGRGVVQVMLADFFLGDQLTSQVLVFRNLQYVACYYPTGFFLTGDDTKCDNNTVFRGLGYVVALLPFWWRFSQVPQYSSNMRVHCQQYSTSALLQVSNKFYVNCMCSALSQ
jgi:hypothetical protein